MEWPGGGDRQSRPSPSAAVRWVPASPAQCYRRAAEPPGVSSSDSGSIVIVRWPPAIGHRVKRVRHPVDRRLRRFLSLGAEEATSPLGELVDGGPLALRSVSQGARRAAAPEQIRLRALKGIPGLHQVVDGTALRLSAVHISATFAVAPGHITARGRNLLKGVHLS